MHVHRQTIKPIKYTRKRRRNQGRAVSELPQGVIACGWIDQNILIPGVNTAKQMAGLTVASLRTLIIGLKMFK